MKIKAIIEEHYKGPDVNGNCFFYSQLTDTDTGRSIMLSTDYPGEINLNVRVLFNSLKQNIYRIHFVSVHESARNWNKQVKNFEKYYKKEFYSYGQERMNLIRKALGL